MARKQISNLPYAKKIKNWFGQGDYTVNTNSIINAAGGDTSNLSLVTHGQHYTDFTFREYLGDIFSGIPSNVGNATSAVSAFNITTYPINPGLQMLHPWLSPIAQQFEQWEPLGYVFEFKSTMTDFSTQTNLGSIIMATDYDVLDQVYTTKVDMMNSQYASEGKPTENMIHGLECDPALRPTKIFYVRSSNPIAVNGVVPDLREYDLGNFSVATVNVPLTRPTSSTAWVPVTLGSLYVHYTVRLYKQQIANGLPMKGQLMSIFSCGTPGGQIPSWTDPFGAGTPTAVWDNMGLIFSTVNRGTSTTSGQIRFPSWITSGIFMVCTHLLLTGVGTGPGSPAGLSYGPAEPLTNCKVAFQAFRVPGQTAVRPWFWAPSNPGTNDSQCDMGVSTADAANFPRGWNTFAVFEITGPNATVALGPYGSLWDGSNLAGLTQGDYVITVFNVGNFNQV